MLPTKKPTGQQLYDLLCQHVGEKYVLGTVVPKDKADYKGPWDCAESVAWGIYQLSGQLYGCANNHGNPHGADAFTGYMSRDADSIGKKISINEAFKTPGALLLRKAANGKTAHIVVSDGKGGTVEANSTKYGFIKSKVTGRRWDIGILPPMIDYSAVTALTDEDVRRVNEKPKGFIFRYTDPMMRDTDKDKGPIHDMQTKLKAAGYYKAAVDGWFGEKMFEAVRSYQADHGLVADGEIESGADKTWKALGL